MIKKLLIFTMCFVLLLLPACTDEEAPLSDEVKAPVTEQPEETGKTLIAYFSRGDENIGVGVIEKGNTCKIAELIAEQVEADMFEIKRTEPYPKTYDECVAEAKKEQEENARPKLTETIDNFDKYDTLYLGYPIWWNDLPMAVYTFLENYDFNGKTIIPFCTHEGSGLADTVESIKSAAEGAEVLEGFEIRGSVAQNDSETSR